VSAFFSGGEACLFSLRQPDRQKLATGTRAQRLAVALLEAPDRLLSAVLFWNLMVNMTYFAVASIVSFRLERFRCRQSLALPVRGWLVVKSDSLQRDAAQDAGGPLGADAGWLLRAAVGRRSAVGESHLARLQLMTLFSRRLIWPRFQPEPYLEISDLGRAIDVSTTDAQLAEQEQMVLNHIVAMSDIRLEEWMRPRTQFLSFRPPVDWPDLEGRMTPSGYLLVTDQEGAEVCGAVDLLELYELPRGNVDRDAAPIVYLPWCATLADAFQQLYQQDRDVAAVVNEFGDTIGVLTYEDISGRRVHRQPQPQRTVDESPADRAGRRRGVAGHGRHRPAAVGNGSERVLAVDPQCDGGGHLAGSPASVACRGGRRGVGPVRIATSSSSTAHARMLVELRLRPTEDAEESAVMIVATVLLLVGLALSAFFSGS
jgi:putative hemolysin